MIAVFVMLLAIPVCAQEERVRLTGTVADAEGELIGGLVVTANAKGAVPVRSLTDREGRFQLLLRPGVWTLTASRLGGEELVSREIRLREGQQREVELREGTEYEKLIPTVAQEPEVGDVGRNRLPDSLQSVQLDPGNLDESGKEAAVELSRLTDTVLLLARQRITGQLAANQFNATFWLVDQLNDETVSSGDQMRVETAGNGQWRDNGFRLGLDLAQRSWAGNIMSENSMMVGVPVNVTIGLRQNRLNDLRESVRGAAGGGTAQGASGWNANQPWSDTLRRNGDSGSFGASRYTGYSLRAARDAASYDTFSLSSFFSKVGSRIANLYRPLRDEYASREAPSSDEIVQRINFDVEKTFLDGLRGTVKYTYSEADGLDVQSIDLHFEDIQDFERFLETGLRHDLSTTVEAAFGATGTRVRASYKLYLADVEDDISFSEGLSQLLGEYSRIDLTLSQRINIGLLSNARISLNVAVTNLLNNRRNSLYFNEDNDLLATQRTYIGGIRIEF